MGWRIRVRGQVQGVGFRPHIWQLAQRFGLNGEVLNDAEGVLILCDTAPDEFITAITAEKPPLSRIDQVEVTEVDYDAPMGFTIAASGAKGAETRVTPDAATCPACCDEIHGDGRRAGYAFTNCTHCGPRFTILNALPYDRAQTTMAPFTMCHDCAAEYADPADRRFHAQPIACPTCGPRIWAEPDGDAIPDTAERILAGQIVAIKGLGGFHLCCDATNTTAIETLRTRKHRPTKPLALMATLDTIHRYARVTDADLALLTDPAAPIVLLPKAEALPDTLAPQQNQLGWMLPYTPLHHLLIEAVGRPLVMTSGNLSGEPQVIGNDEAREKLSRFADAFLMHDRDIARRLDDSVERATPPMILRRARGRVPSTIPLPEGFEPLDLLQSVLMVLTQIRDGRAEVENQYARIVPEHGNPISIAAINDVYERRPSFEWRGLGEIDASGLKIRDSYKAFDAEEKFGIGYAAGPRVVQEPEGCECGAVMTGRMKPTACPQFGKGCTPEMPLGALMVSSEGACAAYWQYGGRRAAEPAE